jgi:hypothetical protein
MQSAADVLSPDGHRGDNLKMKIKHRGKVQNDKY